MDQDSSGPARSFETRWVEVVVALLIVAVGAVVIVDSHRVGIGWGEEGPKAGYFPNFIGWILAVAGTWIAGETLFKWKALAGKTFVTWDALKPVLLMLAPTVVYVALLPFIGIYIASALYIGAFMRIQGGYRWLPTLGVAIGVPLIAFLLFERWFLVPLPKGPIERMLGF